MLRTVASLRIFLSIGAVAIVTLVIVLVLQADTESTPEEDSHVEETSVEESPPPAPETPTVELEGWDAVDTETGRTLSTGCIACHGSDGNAPIPEYSNLAGQSSKYLFVQLKAIQTGERPIPLMAGQLTQLNDQDLRNISAYYASLPGRIGQSKEDGLELGEAIYRGGILDKQIAACTACHAPNGNGNSLAGFPRVSGQPVEYTINQLKAYREGERTSDEYVGGMMRDIAERLSDKEIEAVANYITGLY